MLPFSVAVLKVCVVCFCFGVLQCFSFAACFCLTRDSCYIALAKATKLHSEKQQFYHHKTHFIPTWQVQNKTHQNLPGSSLHCSNNHHLLPRVDDDTLMKTYRWILYSISAHGSPNIIYTGPLNYKLLVWDIQIQRCCIVSPIPQDKFFILEAVITTDSIQKL